MDINVISNKENKLLGRSEIEFDVVEDGATASKNDLRGEIGKKLSLNPDNVIIVKLEQRTGVRQAHGVAHAYASKEQLEKMEPLYLVNRMKGIKGKAAPAKEEKPKEQGAEKKEGKKDEKAEAKAEGKK